MLTGTFLLVQAFIVGAIIGSFLNVVIYRLPLEKSIVRPASHCPHCGVPIPPWQNIPIVSWLMLRGRCAGCGDPISPRYPVVELANALLYAFVIHTFGLSFQGLAGAVYCSSLLVVTGIDFDHKLIPDVITLPGMILGLACSPFLPHGFLDALLALFAGGGFFWFVAAASDKILGKPGMGGGDIKLTAMMGAFLGLQSLVVAVFISLLSGSLVSLVLMAMGRKSRKDVIPFGPFLALGGAVAFFWGRSIFAWYLAFTAI
jgi:leader peptidase (prepilin peptidase)/N-methyltransferase